MEPEFSVEELKCQTLLSALDGLHRHMEMMAGKENYQMDQLDQDRGLRNDVLAALLKELGVA